MTITNDGATILKSIYVDNPAAKVLVGTLQSKHLHAGRFVRDGVDNSKRENDGDTRAAATGM